MNLQIFTTNKINLILIKKSWFNTMQDFAITRIQLNFKIKH